MLDYETLKLVWWVLLTLIILGFTLTSGIDLGTGTVFPLLAHSDLERATVAQANLKAWASGHAWLLVSIVALAAVWPHVLSVVLTGFAGPIFLLLALLMIRPAIWSLCQSYPSGLFRLVWPWLIAALAATPGLAFGITIGNLFAGVPFQVVDQQQVVFGPGPSLSLVSGFPLLAGVISAAMLVMHGSLFLQAKSRGVVQNRARAAVLGATALIFVLLPAGGMFMSSADGFIVKQIADVGLSLSPGDKLVQTEAGAWLINYDLYPWMFWAPVGALGGTFLAAIFSGIGMPRAGFAASSAAITGIIATAALSLFPFVLPSSLDANSSLTLWDAVSRESLLNILLLAAACLLPLLIVYTLSVFRVMADPILIDDTTPSRHPELATRSAARESGY